MELDLSPADRAFVAEVEAFVRSEVPADSRARLVRGYTPSRADIAGLMSRLHARGWIAPTWPVEYGGTEWPPLKRHLFEEVMIAHDAPTREFDIINLVGPVIYTFGSPEQKARFLGPMLRGEEFWCQGFSEPNAGSDLTSLKTSAVRQGDHYVVNGQKTWTSRAHQSDWIFALVRTDPASRRGQGISFLLIDLRSPGVTVRPIRTLNGELFLNEVFFNDVETPLSNLVGEEGQGWSYAKFLLARERSRAAEVPYSKRDLAFLKRIAATAGAGERPLIENPHFERRLLEVEVDLMALEASMLRVAMLPNHETSVAAASVLKIRGSEMRQRLSELLIETLGEYALAYYPDPEPETAGQEAPLTVGPAHAAGIMSTYLHRRATSIYGGSNQIQRNIIAKNILKI